jgi:transaldolase
VPIISDCLSQSDDDTVVADLVQGHLVGRICDAFAPLYERTGGREGLVSIQGSPAGDGDASIIIAEGRAARAIAPNATPKIPATAPGLQALEVLVAEGSAVIVTEVFSLAQVAETCERWLSVTARTGIRPAFIMAPITGILGDHLKKVAARDGTAATNEAMEMAGVLLSRACYRLVRDREYPVTLLYGGARNELDFSGLIGGGMAATINWSTAEQLLSEDPEVAAAIDDLVDPVIEAMLLDAFPEMRQALALDGLTLDAFESFGPVQHFRDKFVAGWDLVLEAIRATRTGAPVASGGVGR